MRQLTDAQLVQVSGGGNGARVPSPDTIYTDITSFRSNVTAAELGTESDGGEPPHDVGDAINDFMNTATGQWLTTTDDPVTLADGNQLIDDVAFRLFDQSDIDTDMEEIYTDSIIDDSGGGGSGNSPTFPHQDAD